MLLAAAGVIGGGMVLNWGWLAVGAAPIIISLAPCAAMCGLGLCMKGQNGQLLFEASGRASEPGRMNDRRLSKLQDQPRRRP